MHLAWRWFTGLGFDREIPHHSTFSKNRHGRFQESKLFEQLFEQIVRQCVEVGLVHTFHSDWRDPNLNKRTFIKVASGMAVSAVTFSCVRVGGRAQADQLGWNLEYGTERLYTATSFEDVQRFVKANNQFKVLGTRHCFNELANSATQFLSLRSQDKIISLDAKAQTVTIESGMSYGQLCPYLDRNALRVLQILNGNKRFLAQLLRPATHIVGVTVYTFSTPFHCLLRDLGSPEYHSMPNTTPPPTAVVSNIKTVAAMEQALLERRSLVDRVADLIGSFSGSMTFVGLHVAW
jgi:hypothetical protein